MNDHLERAIHAANEKRFRDAADEFWAAFLSESIHEKYNGNRYDILCWYTTLCKLRVNEGIDCLANENDQRNLQCILEDKREPRLFRAKAGFDLAKILYFADRPKSEDMLEHASMIARRIPKQGDAAKEDSCMILCSIGDEWCEKSMSELIRKLLTDGSLSFPPPSKPVFDFGIGISIPVAKDGHILSCEELANLLTPGGLKCDYCKCVDKELSRCSGCNSAWYCGRECQEKQWYERSHKEYCRKKDQYKPGDLVQITHLQDEEHTIVMFGFNQLLRNGRIAWIVGRDPSTNEEKYIVRFFGITINEIPFNPFNECWEISLKPENLCHLRPYDCRI